MKREPDEKLPKARDDDRSLHDSDTTGDAPTAELENSMRSSSVGKALGDYVILEPIGAGGGGMVYKAQHQRMGRLVAIKVMRPATMNRPNAVERFQREVRAAAKLIHPNIVTAFDAGEQDGLHYLVMEFVDGKSLSAIVNERGPLPVEVAVDYVLQTARGLAYAHSRNVIHRDIKPGNIVADADGAIKVLDMGLAIFGDHLSDDGHSLIAGLTQSGIIVGTVFYMSPEQASQHHRVDRRTDIYSLGCTLFFLLMGRPVYIGGLVEAVLAHAREPIPKLKHLRDDIPPWLDETFQRMMAKDPDGRHDTMAAVIDELEQGLAEEAAGGAVTNAAANAAASDDVWRYHVSPHVGRSIAIHLGTKWSSAACLGDDRIPISVPSGEGESTAPSCVSIDADAVAIGSAALRLPRDVTRLFADRLFRAIRHQALPGTLGNKEYPWELPLALVLRKVADDTKEQIGYFDDVVLAVPGGHGEVFRKALEDVAFIASVEIAESVDQSAAIAAWHCFQQGWLNPRKEPRHSAPACNLLVYHLGAGTFEAAVFRYDEKKLKTLAVVSDHDLGGYDWDERLVHTVSEKFLKHYQVDPRNDPQTLRALRSDCELAKHGLTKKQSVDTLYHAGKHTLQGTLSRKSFESLCRDLVGRSLLLTNRALQIAGIDWKEVDKFLVGGGGARMPMVGEALRAAAGVAVKPTAIDEQAISQGAALYAYVKRQPDSSDLHLEIEKVNPQSIGVICGDRTNSPHSKAIVLPRNIPLPSSKKCSFKTSKAGQTSVLIQIVQGDSDVSAADVEIGYCQVRDLPPGLPAGSSIELEFKLSAGGQLSVVSESNVTGRRSLLEIRRASGLTTWQRDYWRDWLDSTLLCVPVDGPFNK